MHREPGRDLQGIARGVVGGGATIAAGGVVVAVDALVVGVVGEQVDGPTGFGDLIHQPEFVVVVAGGSPPIGHAEQAPRGVVGVGGTRRAGPGADTPQVNPPREWTQRRRS